MNFTLGEKKKSQIFSQFFGLMTSSSSPACKFFIMWGGLVSFVPIISDNRTAGGTAKCSEFRVF